MWTRLSAGKSGGLLQMLIQRETTRHYIQHGAVPRRLLNVKWIGIRQVQLVHFGIFHSVTKLLLHSEAFTELHVYSCKRMYIASALFYCNSNRISHMNRVSQFSVLDVGQILIIHKKQEIKQIFFNTTIIYWEYQLFVNRKMSHILLLFYLHEKNK